MAVSARLAALAARTLVRVLPVAVGAAARHRVTALLAAGGVRVVDTPRHASVLLVAGTVPPELHRELGRLHDQLVHPRATVRWGGESPLFPAHVDGERPEPVSCPADSPVEEVVGVLRSVQRGLLTGRRSSDPDVLPPLPPAFWKGVGPYGTGGLGMMGGRPYGRAMAMTGDDRDGLALDALPARVGPFMPGWPVGLRLDLTLQGDLVQQAEVAENPCEGGAVTIFHRAQGGSVGVAELELARASHHLRWLAWGLKVAGLPALGSRAAGLACDLDLDDGARVQRLVRLVHRSGALRWGGRGIGVLPAGVLGPGLGVVGRASGVEDDARTGDPAYRQLGFAPLVEEAGDVAARWSLRLDEVVQSLELARAASAADVEPRVQGPVEAPWGALGPDRKPAARLLGLLPQLLADREWGELAATVVSLDLDLGEAARERRARVPT